MIPTMAASATECQKTNRKIMPSLPTWLVAEVATTMDCASTILPITPPELWAAHIRIGSILSRSGNPLQAAEESIGGGVAAEEERGAMEQRQMHGEEKMRGPTSPRGERPIPSALTCRAPSE